MESGDLNAGDELNASAPSVQTHRAISNEAARADGISRDCANARADDMPIQYPSLQFPLHETGQVVNPPPDTPSVGHRRTGPTHSSIHPSTSYSAQTVPPSDTKTPVAHIMAKGFDETLPLSGHRCYICKRDLSFAPDGHIFQPTIPPAVAVLPCSHAFHDVCLQRITPPDQATDPPCIPCAIGES